MYSTLGFVIVQNVRHYKSRDTPPHCSQRAETR